MSDRSAKTSSANNEESLFYCWKLPNESDTKVNAEMMKNVKSCICHFIFKFHQAYSITTDQSAPTVLLWGAKAVSAARFLHLTLTGPSRRKRGCQNGDWLGIDEERPWPSEPGGEAGLMGLPGCLGNNRQRTQSGDPQTRRLAAGRPLARLRPALPADTQTDPRLPIGEEEGHMVGGGTTFERWNLSAGHQTLSWGVDSLILGDATF